RNQGKGGSGKRFQPYLRSELANLVDVPTKTVTSWSKHWEPLAVDVREIEEALAKWRSQGSRGKFSDYLEGEGFPVRRTKLKSKSPFLPAVSIVMRHEVLRMRAETSPRTGELYTQVEVAAELGVETTTISFWERGLSGVTRLGFGSN